MKNNAKKKRVMLLVLVLILLLMPLLMAPSPPRNASISWKGKANKFDIDKVEIEISFGQNFSRNANFDYSEYGEVSVFLYDGGKYIWFDDEQSLATLATDLNFHLIKTILPEEFYTDTYFASWTHPWSCSRNASKNTFNHSEKIQIPQRLFSQDIGIITLIIRVERLEKEKDEDVMEKDEYIMEVAENESDFRAIYYKKDGQKIKISSKSFD